MPAIGGNEGVRLYIGSQHVSAAYLGSKALPIARDLYLFGGDPPPVTMVSDDSDESGHRYAHDCTISLSGAALAGITIWASAGATGSVKALAWDGTPSNLTTTTPDRTSGTAVFTGADDWHEIRFAEPLPLTGTNFVAGYEKIDAAGDMPYYIAETTFTDPTGNFTLTSIDSYNWSEADATPGRFGVYWGIGLIITKGEA